jgi:hypothetical protein
MEVAKMRIAALKDRAFARRTKNSTVRILCSRNGLHVLRHIAFFSKSILFENQSEKWAETSIIKDLTLSKITLEIQSKKS